MFIFICKFTCVRQASVFKGQYFEIPNDNGKNNKKNMTCIKWPPAFKGQLYTVTRLSAAHRFDCNCKWMWVNKRFYSGLSLKQTPSGLDIMFVCLQCQIKMPVWLAQWLNSRLSPVWPGFDWFDCHWNILKTVWKQEQKLTENEGRFK